ncbi:hypothetical protein [Ekhidna sp.]|uniref:hypothetical protein n=1 Tax=Ekhidna sp. TaxID=2608089 RepID=UPI003B50A225
MIKKKNVLAVCIDLLDRKISDLKSEIEEVRQSVITDSKSSMGDKYETGREVMNQERNRLNGQLDIFYNQLSSLKSIDPDLHISSVKHGSLVTSENGIYFISVPLGLIDVDGQKVFAISIGAPIAKSMEGKKAAETIDFGGKSFKLLDIK